MKTLTCTTPGIFEYSETQKPELKTDHAIIKIKRIGICGTDLHAFEGTQPFFNYPRVLGHELSGELVEIDGNKAFKIGEAVTFIPYFYCGECIANYCWEGGRPVFEFHGNSSTEWTNAQIMDRMHFPF